jgi:hypothetical protein
VRTCSPCGGTRSRSGGGEFTGGQVQQRQPVGLIRVAADDLGATTADIQIDVVPSVGAPQAGERPAETFAQLSLAGQPQRGVLLD